MEELEIIKQQIESWKKQCGYDMPFDYYTLKILLDNKKGDDINNSVEEYVIDRIVEVREGVSLPSYIKSGY